MKKKTRIYTLALALSLLTALLAPFSFSSAASTVEIPVVSANVDCLYNNMAAGPEACIPALRQKGHFWFNASMYDTPGSDSIARPGERYLTLELGKTADLSSIHIQWYQGNGPAPDYAPTGDKQRKYFFVIQASKEVTGDDNFVDIYGNYENNDIKLSGTGVDAEKYIVNFEGAKRIRIWGFGNDGGAESYGSLNFAIRSIRVYGTIPESPESVDGSIYYQVTNGEAIITKCDKSVSGALVIPSVLGDFPVTDIENAAFSGCTGLTSVILPTSVTRVPDSGFKGCTSLKSVAIPEGVTRIGSGAFEGCTSLESITIPASVTNIGAMAFYNCSALTSITLPENVTIVGAEAFYGCTALTAATILNTSTTLGYGSNTFYGVPAAFAIYGYKSSTAETYASDNGHAFVDLNAEPEKEIVPGDCDGDGKVSMNDLTLLAKYLAGHDVTLG